MPTGLRFLFLTSFFGAAACAAAHVLTFADIAFYPIYLFLPLLFLVWIFAVWHMRRVPRKNLISEIFVNVPRWMKVSTALLFAYVFINFFACMYLLDGGNTERMSDQRLVLKSKGKILRDLTPAQFRHAEAVQIRMLTGHLLVFFTVAGFIFYTCWLKTGPAMANAKIFPPEKIH
jgi:hypothetical protein